LYKDCNKLVVDLSFYMNPLQEASSEANRKSTVLVVAGVVCTILIIAIFAILIQIRNKPEHRIEEKHESIDCTDFDPCTRDYKVKFNIKDKEHHRRNRENNRHHDDDNFRDEHHHDDDDDDDTCFIDDDDDEDHHHDIDHDFNRHNIRNVKSQHHHHRRRKCPKDLCIHEPMINGSCCNKYDYCYYDDPCKKCVFGTCQSPNASLCKGFCNTDADCNITLPISAEFILNSCVFNSCVTVFESVTPVPNPISLINTGNGNFTALSIKSCISAVCFSSVSGDPLSNSTFCYFTWNCAPFIGAEPTPESKKKRDENTQNLPIMNIPHFNSLSKDSHHVLSHTMYKMAGDLHSKLTHSKQMSASAA
jgi:hypothetical protein